MKFGSRVLHIGRCKDIIWRGVLVLLSYSGRREGEREERTRAEDEEESETQREALVRKRALTGALVTAPPLQ